MLSAPTASSLARAEEGFTLVELLVAIVTGLVITFALYAILEVSTRQTALITNRVQASRSGRLTMTKIVDELHSACLAESIAPVLEGSGPTKLIFENAYSEKAEIPTASEDAKEGIYKHELVPEAETAGSPALLIDKAYPSTAITSWPSEIAFSSTAGKTVLGEYITQEEVGEAKQPFFKYYEYDEEAGATESLKPISVTEGSPLTKTTAAKVAAVAIHFRAWPKYVKAERQRELEHEPAGGPLQHASVNLGTQVTLAFTSPAAETPIKDSPCS